MEDLSVILWTELCRVVGTKAQVYIRRKCKLLDSILYRNSDIVPLSSGSKAEGLNLPGSDTDFMIVWKTVKVFPASYTHNQNCGLCIETDNVKPGFALIRVVDRVSSRHDPYIDIAEAYIARSIIEMNSRMYVSSALFVHQTVEAIRGSNLVPDVDYHGPCATGVHQGFEYDHCLCLHCPVLPNEVSEWIHRHRPNDWPSTELVQQIVVAGCLLVPIGNPISSNGYIEWRLSFSVAEEMLIFSMNHTQFLCYGLLKLYLKYVIDSNMEVNGLLCSYFLKTCLFYCIEEENISWTKENLINCFWICFKRLHILVRQGYCPNYFIKENNMFQSKVHGENQRRLVHYLNTLYAQELYGFLKIPCLSDLVGRSRIALDNYFLSESEQEFLCDIELFKFLRASTKYIK